MPQWFDKYWTYNSKCVSLRKCACLSESKWQQQQAVVIAERFNDSHDCTQRTFRYVLKHMRVPGQISVGQPRHVLQHSLRQGAKNAAFIHCAQRSTEREVSPRNLLYYRKLLLAKVTGAQPCIFEQRIDVWHVHQASAHELFCASNLWYPCTLVKLRSCDSK